MQKRDYYKLPTNELGIILSGFKRARRNKVQSHFKHLKIWGQRSKKAKGVSSSPVLSRGGEAYG